jgi:hypothetical protein
MSATLTRETLSQLLSQSQPPCISLYQPTHRSFPEREQDPIRFKQLVRRIESELKERAAQSDIPALLKPFLDLIDDKDFWNHSRDSLAIFATPGFFRLFRLQRSVPELVVVNDRLHVKPLLRITQSADRYQVLCLARDRVRLFEGNRDALDEVELAQEVPRNIEQALGDQLTDKDQSGKVDGFSRAGERGDAMQHAGGGLDKQTHIDNDRERFFRAVDKAITLHHSRPSGLPLLLAALPENQTEFRRISHNELLADEAISLGEGALDNENLRRKAWEAMQPRYTARLDKLLDQFGESNGQGLASDRLDEIGSACMEGRIATLLVDVERTIPGKAVKDEGRLLPMDESKADLPDLLDELAVWTLERGGEVLALPHERMPTRNGVAALYRY